MKRAAKIDRNQPEIVAALRGMGATVTSLAQVGRGCPDLLIGWRGKNILAEVKDGNAPKSDQRLNPGQVEWHSSWRGQVATVRSIEEAAALLILPDDYTQAGADAALYHDNEEVPK